MVNNLTKEKNSLEQVSKKLSFQLDKVTEECSQIRKAHQENARKYATLELKYHDMRRAEIAA